MAYVSVLYLLGRHVVFIAPSVFEIVFLIIYVDYHPVFENVTFFVLLLDFIRY